MHQWWKPHLIFLASRLSRDSEVVIPAKAGIQEAEVIGRTWYSFLGFFIRIISPRIPSMEAVP